MDDRQIVAGMRLGERNAIAELYDRYADALHDYARRRTHTAADAADVVHDAILVAVERIEQLRDPDRLRPWLYAIARTELHRRYRQAARYAELDTEDEPVSQEPGPEALAQRGELVELLREATAGLADADRELLDLHLRHGLVGADLAAAAGMPAKHASVALERVRARLTRTLGVVLLARAPVCTEFIAINAGQPGMSPLARKRLARHVDDCEVCRREQSRRLRPEVLLAALPMLIAPRELRARLLSSVEAGRPGPTGQSWDREGFPWPAADRRRRWPLAVAAAAAVLLLIGAALLVRRPWAAESAVSAHDTTDPAATTTTTTGAPAVPGALLAGTTTTPPPSSTTTTTTTTRRTSTTTTTSRTTTSTTTTAPDNAPPVIGPVGFAPTPLSTTAGAGPTCASLPTRATVTATVTDQSGVSSVTMTWSGPAGTGGEAVMTRGTGNTYVATIGPVDGGNLRDGFYNLVVSIEATDVSGNRPASSKSNYLRAVEHCNPIR